MAKDNKDGGEVVESTIDISEIPGEEKAAILLLSLNEEDAAGIIRHLEPKQVQRVGSAMARAKDLSQTKVSAVHRAFLEDIQKYTNIGMGSEDFLRNALVAALGADKANNLVDQILLGTATERSGFTKMDGSTSSSEHYYQRAPADPNHRIVVP